MGVAAEAGFFRFFEAGVADSADALERSCVFDLGLDFGGLPRFGVGELPRNSAFEGGGGV